ncbi:MAG TPA: xanthine dehydrogenase [Rhodospirillaceae bacterium]|nr:xanthine dehydrogenase [Rhodospirillaceae bacterium]HAA93799.1 xanthine dehydrogenase [Rhodospirillaceae bacterium]HAT35434.1 xanthine dehydrogenase [Rhodospirillaceae bacterium]|tara:strand:+ start:197 stop:907 length:711 start_codon:yes stop_codon:yes gene_type:complete
MKASDLKSLNQARSAKQQAALVTPISGGSQTLVVDGDVVSGPELDASLKVELAAAFAADRSRMIGEGEDRTFIHIFNPPKRMILVGAVHIAQSLAPMAALSGYDVTVIDPRGAFATNERFPGVTLITEWPDDAMPKLTPDRRTAIVTLTHDPKIDDPALVAALNSEAFYIGSLGSRRTHASRLERLRAEGFGDTELDRIHGPVGLNIGAVSPAEIAISILGQVTEVLHRPRQDKAA